MVRDVNLISHLPEFMQAYREIKHITEAENPDVQAAENESEKVKNNQFILTCDVNGIKKFEKLLSICPEKNDTIESRRARVLSRWNDDLPYTFRGLLEKLDLLCGQGNYCVLLTPDSYEINLLVHLPLCGQAEELERMLSGMVPANIKVGIDNDLKYGAAGSIISGSATVEMRKFEITSELIHEIKGGGHVKNGGAVTSKFEYTIS